MKLQLCPYAKECKNFEQKSVHCKTRIMQFVNCGKFKEFEKEQK